MDIFGIITKKIFIFSLLGSIQLVAMEVELTTQQKITSQTQKMYKSKKRNIQQMLCDYKKALFTETDRDERFMINNDITFLQKELQKLRYMKNVLGIEQVGIIIAHTMINPNPAIKRGQNEIRQGQETAEQKRQKIAADGSYIKKYY